jgi:hypothetical protein
VITAINTLTIPRSYRNHVIGEISGSHTISHSFIPSHYKLPNLLHRLVLLFAADVTVVPRECRARVARDRASDLGRRDLPQQVFAE